MILYFNINAIKETISLCIELETDHLTWRGRGGCMFFFLKKIILIPNVAEKNILILVEEKKNNRIQSFCHIT